MDNNKTTKSKFLSVTVLNSLITIAEFIGGILSGSLGLISDAIHNLQDTVSIVISYVAYVIGNKKSDSKKTFGYKRAEILAAFVNAGILILITLFLIIESIKRMGNPQQINGSLMLIVSFVGLLANGFSMLILLKDSKKNLNIKATMLHMLSDTVSSVSIVIAAIFIQLFNWYWIDPIVTLLVSVWILKEAYDVLKESANILMEASPNINLDDVKSSILTIPEIKNVHHAHIWMINENMILFDAHINIEGTENIINTEKLYKKIHDILLEKYGITHTTIQVECKNGMQEPLIK